MKDDRIWFKPFKTGGFQGSWNIFFRKYDGFFISHNGTIFNIRYCPLCGNKLSTKIIPDEFFNENI